MNIREDIMSEKEIKEEQIKSIKKIIFIIILFTMIQFNTFLSDKIDHLRLFHGLSLKGGILLEIFILLCIGLILYFVFKPKELWPEFQRNSNLSPKEKDIKLKKSIKRILFFYLLVEPLTYIAFKDLLYKFFHSDILSIVTYFSFKLILGILIFRPKKLWPEFFDKDSLRNIGGKDI